MAKLSEDELREIISQAVPDATVDDLPRAGRTPPASSRRAPNRADLAAKIAKVRGGLDGAIDPDSFATPPLDADDSRMITLTFDEAEDTPRRQATVVSTETGEIVAEQG